MLKYAMKYIDKIILFEAVWFAKEFYVAFHCSENSFALQTIKTIQKKIKFHLLNRMNRLKTIFWSTINSTFSFDHFEPKMFQLFSRIKRFKYRKHTPKYFDYFSSICCFFQQFDLLPWIHPHLPQSITIRYLLLLFSGIIIMKAHLTISFHRFFISRKYINRLNQSKKFLTCEIWRRYFFLLLSSTEMRYSISNIHKFLHQ